MLVGSAFTIRLLSATGIDQKILECSIHNTNRQGRPKFEDIAPILTFIRSKSDMCYTICPYSTRTTHSTNRYELINFRIRS